MPADLRIAGINCNRDRRRERSSAGRDDENAAKRKRGKTTAADISLIRLKRPASFKVLSF
jgi:hypothetical protein